METTGISGTQQLAIQQRNEKFNAAAAALNRSPFTGAIFAVLASARERVVPVKGTGICSLQHKYVSGANRMVVSEVKLSQADGLVKWDPGFGLDLYEPVSVPSAPVIGRVAVQLSATKAGSWTLDRVGERVVASWVDPFNGTSLAMFAVPAEAVEPSVVKPRTFHRLEVGDSLGAVLLDGSQIVDSRQFTLPEGTQAWDPLLELGLAMAQLAEVPDLEVPDLSNIRLLAAVDDAIYSQQMPWNPLLREKLVEAVCAGTVGIASPFEGNVVSIEHSPTMTSVRIGLQTLFVPCRAKLAVVLGDPVEIGQSLGLYLNPAEAAGMSLLELRAALSPCVTRITWQFLQERGVAPTEEQPKWLLDTALLAESAKDFVGPEDLYYDMGEVPNKDDAYHIYVQADGTVGWLSVTLAAEEPELSPEPLPTPRPRRRKGGRKQVKALVQ